MAARKSSTNGTRKNGSRSSGRGTKRGQKTQTKKGRGRKTKKEGGEGNAVLKQFQGRIERIDNFKLFDALSSTEICNCEDCEGKRFSNGLDWLSQKAADYPMLATITPIVALLIILGVIVMSTRCSG